LSVTLTVATQHRPGNTGHGRQNNHEHGADEQTPPLATMSGVVDTGAVMLLI
jgi:hypothetical protein